MLTETPTIFWLGATVVLAIIILVAIARGFGIRLRLWPFALDITPPIDRTLRTKSGKQKKPKTEKGPPKDAH